MPDILIKDLPDALHRKLKKLAARNHRSMTREALVLLEEGLQRVESSSALPPVFKGRFPVTKEFVEKAKRAGRL